MSVHIGHKGKYILILGKGPKQGLNITTLTTEAQYSINFAQPSNSFLFINATKIFQFKVKNSEIKKYALCLGNISKDFTINEVIRSKKILLNI